MTDYDDCWLPIRRRKAGSVLDSRDMPDGVCEYRERLIFVGVNLVVPTLSRMWGRAREGYELLGDVAMYEPRM